MTTADSKRIRLDDVIGFRFAVLSWGSDPQVHMSDAVRQYWASIGAEMIAVVPPTQVGNFRGRVSPGTRLVGDAQDTLHEWFADQDADGSIVVLRPDRFVAAIVPPQRLDEASRRLAGLIGGDVESGIEGPAADHAATLDELPSVVAALP